MTISPPPARPFAWPVLIMIAAIAVAALASGCVSVAFHHPDGARATYTRFGSQEIQGFSASVGDTEITIEAARSDASQLIEAAARGLSAGVR